MKRERDLVFNSLCMQTWEKETDRKTESCFQQTYDQNRLWGALTAASWQGLSEEAFLCVAWAPFCNHATKQTGNPKLDFGCEHFALAGKQQAEGGKLPTKQQLLSNILTQLLSNSLHKTHKNKTTSLKDGCLLVLLDCIFVVSHWSLRCGAVSYLSWSYCAFFAEPRAVHVPKPHLRKNTIHSHKLSAAYSNRSALQLHQRFITALAQGCQARPSAVLPPPARVVS